MKAGIEPGAVIGVSGPTSLVFDGTVEGIDLAHVVDQRGRHGRVKPLVALSVHGPWTAPTDVAKHGDPSRPGYAALHPSSRTGSATAPSLGHDGTPLPSGWSLLSAEDRVAERMRQRDAGYGDQSSREARDRRDGDLWEIRRQERALTVYEGAGGARVYLDRIPLADGEDHHVVSQLSLIHI